MKTKATTGLFRFTTFRAPQLVDTDRKTLGFIYHPDPASSHFLNGIPAEAPIETARNIVTAAANTYPSGNVFRSVAELKQYSPVLWEFSSRLMKSRGTLTHETDLEPPFDLLDPGATPPVGSMKTRLWDNVFYDLVRRANRPVREVCLQMIIAINYLERLDDGIASDTEVERYVQYPRKPEEMPVEEKRALLLQRLANAAVVIHPAFSRYKEQDYGNLQAATFRKRKYRTQQARHAAELAKRQYIGLGFVKDELTAFGTKYDRDRQDALDEAKNLYDRDVADIQDRWIGEHAELVARLEKENEANPDFDIRDYVQEALYPPFAFTFEEPFSDGYSRGKLSPATVAWVKANHLERSSVAHAIGMLDGQQRKERKEAAQVFRPGMARGILNGVPFEGPTAELYDYTFSFTDVPVQPEGKEDIEMKRGFFLSIILDRDEVCMEEAVFHLDVGGSGYEDGGPQLLGNNSGRVFITAFDKDTIKVTLNDRIRFSADIRLDNGVQLRIKREGMYVGHVFSGTAELVRGHDATEPIHYGISSIGVADHRLVEQEVCCYIPGEVSHIENVMAREYREKSSRSLLRTEDTTVHAQAKEVEMVEDNVSTTRNELATEVASVLQTDRASNFGFDARANGTAIAYSWGVGMQADFSFSRSTSDSNSVARLYAEDVTRRALERITQSVSITRTSTIIREYEENNKHGFDNRGGGDNVTGIYRWVDKVYTNRLVNYGKRLIYEFMVPEPARFYKLAIVVEAVENNGHGTGTGGTGQPALQSPPVSPESEGIKSFEDINEDNYASIAALYGVTSLEPPPLATASAEKTIGGGEVGGTAQSQNHMLMLPQDYQLSQLLYAGHADKRKNGYIKISAAGMYYENASGSSWGYFEISKSQSYSNGPDGTLDIVVNLKKIRNWSVLVRANCTLKSEVYQSWQQATYTAIMDAYNAQLQAYNDAAAAAAAAAEAASAAQADEADAGRNPQFNEQVVQTEIKRLCIEMMMAPFGFSQGARDFYRDGACGIPTLPSDRELGDYKILVDFFEQAFDWNIMAQTFYPYYWAQRCRWKELFQATDSNDQGFQAFLQSGMAKVVVPIKPGYEAAVGFFMETGDVWTGSRMVIHTDDETYLSLVDEMNAVEGFVEAEWQTTVPTTLTIIQKNSALLNVGGLPCCETDADEPIEDLLKEDTNRLKRLEQGEPVPEPEE